MSTAQRRRAERSGRLAEGLSAWWLTLRGYRVLDRRVRSPAGEIDIVARRGRTLAVVEVKARRDWEGAAQSVTLRQRRRIGRAAAAYLARNPGLDGLEVRFDVMLVVPWRPPRHIMDAWR
jgi:putative endonuclease